MADTVKTSAQPDRDPATLMDWEGTLIRDAQARTKAIDLQGHMVPVLIVHVRLDKAADKNPLCLEQPFEAGHEAQCEAAARRLRKGMRISAQGPRAHVHLKQEHVLHIHVHQPEETTV